MAAVNCLVTNILQRVFSSRKELIQVNNLSMSKLWHNIDFWVIYPFKSQVKNILSR